MRRIVLVLLGALALLLVGSQLVIPRIAEGEAEDRLERRGGKADVSVSAFPAVRLLFDDGDKITVRGSGLRLDPDSEADSLTRMDGFDEVSVELEDFTAGPMHARTFRMKRAEGDEDYRTRTTGTTSAAEVGSFLGSQAGGAFGGLLGSLAGGSLPGGGAQVPVEVDAVIASRKGEVQVQSATGTVAGVPADPLIQIVVGAVAASI
jgi:hypothetical protein